ncbi:MAG: ankyrin repeat domain-containing protein [Muricauda sp.]|uniref:Ankyrin repeat protein n=1 Tax=Flagellimonas lutaonensis TaxID=516051 RepID=A0A0D5YU39_9FLAO|nr:MULTISPECIES: ankyrin repeat domain-containing protein [Allomuricauda]AKA35745.1 Ankyrin repeat protein [Allomuricauda lutaonensis]MAU26173.1 ankyrin repeat domain-containing protein [Allomuricauda sp.]MBC32125.1 ankyrin repeat domain-containing protein [Allomuricauda sp.]
MKKTILTLLLVCAFGVAQVSALKGPVKVTKDIDLIEDFKLNSFCTAIMKGDVATVKKMIELGEDVNQKSLGMAPIHYAARYNKAEILQVLLANGADVKRRCDKGFTAVKHAELSNAMDALKVLKAAMKK